ncbi:MAG: 50S ribosomal protein L5 [Thaumarchaeota archaeon]|jgi:large subunit ribosomal protein L5|nr:50S ribosomal protein L5 [Candidatus Geocrenenecus arthurdayi]MCL7403585.1 50S ribosomal protein L5 [Candidatus Geocrenenecus arthurdayi]
MGEQALNTSMSALKLDNPMRRIRVEKVIVNCSVGKSGAPLERAEKILEMLTGQKPSVRKAKKTIRGFGIHHGEPIAVMVTLRRDKAREFLQKAFAAIGYRVREENFDQYGNLAFGIKEHLDIPGTKYNPELGVIGMDVIIHVSRPGRRVMLRRRARSKIGKNHLVTREESMKFFQEEFGVKIVS